MTDDEIKNERKQSLMMIRMSDNEFKLMHGLVQDALIDEVRKSQGCDEGMQNPKRETELEKLEKKLR